MKAVLLQWYRQDFVVGRLPFGVAFDGVNVSVANTNDNSVTQLASNGTPVGTLLVGSGPTGIAFDGANIWGANLSDNTSPLIAGRRRI